MSSLKRHFTAVIGKKEQGSYTSSSPSSAARKAVSKLCADDKNRKVEFYMRETTQASDKKVYGLYSGYMEKLKKPIELKGRVIRYKPVAKLLKNKKMRGGGRTYTHFIWDTYTNNKPELKKKLEEKLNGLYTNYNEENLNTNYNEENLSNKTNLRETLFISEFGIQIAEDYPNLIETKKKIRKALRELEIPYEEKDRTAITIHHFKWAPANKKIKEDLQKKFTSSSGKLEYTPWGLNNPYNNNNYKNKPPSQKFFIAQDEIRIAEDYPDFTNIRKRIIAALNELKISFEEVLDT